MIRTITQQLKRFADDERAVSPVVGFVLLFALIIIVFTIYQAEVVPAQNEAVEFEHSQTVAGQMRQLSSAVIDTSSTGEPRSVTIDTGVQYPSRAFAINPGNPVGTLETVETDGVTISGLDTEHGNGTYTFDTSFIVYRSQYNLLSEETEYSIQHGMLLKEYSSSGIVALESAGPLFSANGRELNLVLIGGNLETHRMTTTVTLVPSNHLTINSSVTTRGMIPPPRRHFPKTSGEKSQTERDIPSKSTTIQVTSIGYGSLSMVLKSKSAKSRPLERMLTE